MYLEDTRYSHTSLRKWILFTKILWDRNYWYPHFYRWRHSDSERLNDLPAVTQPVNGRARTIWLQSQRSSLSYLRTAWHLRLILRYFNHYCRGQDPFTFCFITALYRLNSCTIQLLKMYKWMVFSIGTELCNHHHN